MKLLEFVSMIDIKKFQQVWSLSFFANKKTGSETRLNEQITEQFHKPVTTNFQKKKSLCDTSKNTWAAYLAEM